ncbi:MAG: sigma 54-interacting transcriptional regulator, partial [Oscillospiraceae bacterium]|nr:sigma 54-interacting transcriptional regulator [Oscillospiraceae bacterium]
MNKAAEDLLQMDQESLKHTGIGNILPGIDWSPDHWDGGRLQSDNVLLQTGDSTRYCSLVAVPLSEYGYHTLAVTMRKQKHLINLANKISGNRAVYTFRDYITTNESMKNTLSLASTFARYEGNILILGESGTGKELLAQAIHNAGANAGGPFVAVNCASIPRELFEMELFG